MTETRFAGFGPDAVGFYQQLVGDNTREFWQAHRAVYDEQIRGPMEALLAELSGEFGTPKVFRPHRDVRFSPNKAPYKTHQGGWIPVGPATGWYLEVSGEGFICGAGFYHADAERLAALRGRIDDEDDGAELERLDAALTASGYLRDGERVKTVPRGWSAQHPRIDLLRHRSLSYSVQPDDALITSAALTDVVRGHWRELRPLLDWLTRP